MERSPSVTLDHLARRLWLGQRHQRISLTEMELLMRKIVFSGLIAAIAFVVYTQITLFVVPPIGAVPEGRTVVMLRLNKTNFIDSPDAMCDRMQGGVSLLCRGMTMAAVVEKTKIIARLPYSDWLYLQSTDGKRFNH
ncbi:hypothetical protein D3C85_721040 [compost metagenome]